MTTRVPIQSDQKPYTAFFLAWWWFTWNLITISDLRDILHCKCGWTTTMDGCQTIAILIPHLSLQLRWAKKFWNECDCSNLLLNTQEMYTIWNLCKIAQVSYFVHFTWWYTFKNPKVWQGKRIFINNRSITEQYYTHDTKETRGLILFHSHIFFWQLSWERNSSFSITQDKTLLCN